MSYKDDAEKLAETIHRFGFFEAAAAMRNGTAYFDIRKLEPIWKRRTRAFYEGPEAFEKERRQSHYIACNTYL